MIVNEFFGCSRHRYSCVCPAALGSANRLLIILRYIFNLAIRWEIPGVTANPTKDVALFEDPNKMERYLSQAEVQRLYAAVCESEN
ncbi:MAG: hypothetical protein WAZ34_12720, partial [Rhodocyclaceae bacterium]